jgi:hypothetical protein
MRPTLHPILVVGFGTVALMSAAVFNGFPLVWPDSGQYIEALDEAQRTPFYGYLIYLLHWRWSLWPVVLAQCLVLAHLLWLTIKIVFPHVGLWGTFCVFTVLAFFSGAPWVTGMIMPDVFAPILVLSLYLLIFHYEEMPGGERWYLSFLVFLSGVTHQSHLVVGAAAVVLAVVVGRVFKPLGVRPARIARWGGIPLSLSVATVVGFTALSHGVFGLSAHGHVFLAARFLADGSAQRILDQECPRPDWKWCEWRGRFTDDSDQILWDPDGPVESLGRIEGVSDEARTLVAFTLRRYPGEVLRQSLRNTGKQLLRFDTGHGLVPYLDQAYPTDNLARVFPHLVTSYAESRQNQDRLWLRLIASIHFWVTMGSLTVFGFLVVAHVRGARIREVRLLGTLLAFLLLNAAVTGSLSAPNNRYQARVMWLVVFVATAGGWSWAVRTINRHRSERTDYPTETASA